VSHETQLARTARRFPTAAERRLWSRLRRDALGWHFRRQHPVPPFVLDFACPSLKLAVEADGGQHSEPGKHDSRDGFLPRQGWLVLRFWNNEILANTDGVIAIIQAACEQRALSSTPSPTLPRATRGRRS
jgi:very-short-patch-repair endonuclease